MPRMVRPPKPTPTATIVAPIRRIVNTPAKVRRFHSTTGAVPFVTGKADTIASRGRAGFHLATVEAVAQAVAGVCFPRILPNGIQY